MKEIALHILDIAQNSIRAGATEIKISVNESPSDDILRVIIDDNGCGMDEVTLNSASDPYFTSRTTRKVGLGLSLLKMNAVMTGGDMQIASSPGAGTKVTATFGYIHVDRPPLGDMSGTITLLITANPCINIEYEHTCGDSSWSISTAEIKEALGGNSVADIQIVKHLRELINENISDIQKEALKYDKN